MRLLEPDIGEVLDRQSILQLKIEAAMQRMISTESWESELKELDNYLQRKMQAWQRTATSFSHDLFGKCTAELTHANARLWRLEDEIRTYIKKRDSGGLNAEDFEAAANVAMTIAEINDIRAALVVRINAMFGSQVEQEKIYG